MLSFFSSNAHENEKLSHPIPIHICRPDGLDDVWGKLTPAQKTYAKARRFAGEREQRVSLPDDTGRISTILLGAGGLKNDMQGPIRTGQLSSALPKGLYKIETMPSDWDASLAAIGWGLGAYKFSKYLDEDRTFPCLDISELSDADEIQALIEASHFGRDLINTPANDMGPVALENSARKLASRFGAKVRVTTGEDLLTDNYPMIHAVGRAAHEDPRLVELEWGDAKNPRIAIIGKGITFDTGGVNIKSASSARIMKKDMGGAAHALALAQMIMANDLPLRIHVLLAIAENSISAGAFRPGDILQSRIGKTIEIDNTDAEGRLVLGDALTRASEDDPELIMDFATLTGAARVALGPKLPPFFCNRDDLIAPVLKHTADAFDPVWNMPLWAPYLNMLSSPIADMKNAGGGFAGCITAALFLEQFAGEGPWMHFDVYGWNPAAAPGHPAGGEVFALRGIYAWLKSGEFKAKS